MLYRHNWRIKAQLLFETKEIMKKSINILIAILGLIHATFVCSWNLPTPMRVWNEAYQENYKEDSTATILAGAKNSYTLIDPFGSPKTRNAIPQIKAKGNLVGCYISSGTCENWRDDFAAIKPYCVKKKWGDWEGEYFVNATNTGLLNFMKKRIDKMASWGCNMVEFDNMDWAFDDSYRKQYGFKVTEAQAKSYNQSLCAYARTKSMKCMAKSSSSQAGGQNFDGLTVESYPAEKDWWVTNDLKNMLNTGRLGVIVHYNETNCNAVHTMYKTKYGNKLSFICEDKSLKKYRHYN